MGNLDTNMRVALALMGKMVSMWPESESCTVASSLKNPHFRIFYWNFASTKMPHKSIIQLFVEGFKQNILKNCKLSIFYFEKVIFYNLIIFSFLCMAISWVSSPTSLNTSQ